MTKEIYGTKRAELMAQAQAFLDEGKIEDSTAKQGEIAKLDTDYENICKAQADLNALNKAGSSIINQIVGGTKMEGKTEYKSVADMYNSDEYRNAFMRNVLAGERIPAQFVNEDAQTATTEVSSVIPTVVMQKIVEKLESYGNILPLVTRTNYKGGLTIPTSSIALTASWVAQRSTSETQEYTTGSITFAYHKLICKVAVSFEVDTVTIDAFEAAFVANITKAMAKTLEQAIFTGTGADNHQPVGFLTATVVTGQNVDITEGAHITYADLCKAEAALPQAYEANAVWTMSKKTYLSEIVGMVDLQGQPIARTNMGLDGKPEYSILGRKVILNPYMTDFSASVAADTIVAAIFNFGDYAINTNYQMTLRKYTDEATDDVITKAIMLADGKIVDKNSLVTVTVKNS